MLRSTKTSGDWDVISDELIELVNQLSNDDVSKILDCFSSRIIVWVDDDDGRKAKNIRCASLNGTFIQLHLEDK